jgi:glycosyltransferase involved in cell wall biosynthesis
MPEPLVSALVAAYNAEPFIEQALRSALDQDWPQLEVIVVDDGSTDGTAAVVERLNDPRIRLIRQENQGACGAVNTAFHAARGELLALLDADDVWPAGKLRAQSAVLAARPEVGLVYGDMTVIDAAGNVLDESFLSDTRPPQGRCLAQMLESNDATASSLLFRRSVGAPIPDGVPYTDWWFAVHAAERSEIAYLPEPRTLYRFHGGNLTLGTEGAAREREMRKAITFRLWFLRRLALSEREREIVWRAIELNAAEVPDVAYTDAAIRADLLAAAPPHEDELLPERFVLAFADELVERPELLERFVSLGAGATLAIDATRGDLEALGELVERVPGAQDCDLLALPALDVVARARLAAGAQAVLSERPLA